MKKFKTFSNKLTQKTNILRKKINEKPLLFFYVSLIALVLLIVAGNILRKPAPELKDTVKIPQEVEVYTLGKAPYISVTAEIEKSGVIKIVALTSGVVQNIAVREGSEIAKGAILMRLASNYQGGNAFSAQRQLAAVQYQHALDTFEAQKDIIAKQKESAQKMDGQSSDLRKITQDSLSETKSLISLNSSIISKLDSNLSVLEADPVTNAETILATKQIKSQFLSAQNQMNSSLRQAEYQSSDNNEPAQLSQLQREITVKQLDLQEKMLSVQKEASRLQLTLARISEGMTTPAAPFSGVVQRVFVKVGQVVNPGTPLAIVSQTKDDPITVVAYVSRDIAQKISTSEPAEIVIRDEKVSLVPHFVSQDAIDNGLYAVYFVLPDSYLSKVADKDHVTVRLSLVADTTATTVPYIPIDAVHQTANSAFVFIEKDGKATAHKVTLGTVFGSLIQVTGLSTNDAIILDRTVTEGTLVTVSPK